MRRTFDPFRLLLISIAGWLGQQQRDAIDYLREENSALREQLGNRRLRPNDDRRRRLAVKAKLPGRRILREVAAGLFTLFMSPAGTLRSAIVLKPSNLLHLHSLLRKCKYRLLFSPRRGYRPGPYKHHADLVVALKTVVEEAGPEIQPAQG